MKNKKITIEPATIKHAKAFYGDQYTKSFKGYVSLRDGEVLAIGGISYQGKTMLLFSDMKDEMRKFKLSIGRGIRVLRNLVEKTKYPVVAVADKTEKLSEELLSSMGFEYRGEMNVDGSKIFWRFP